MAGESGSAPIAVSRSPQKTTKHAPGAALVQGRGLRVRFARIRGETPADILRTPLYLPAVVGAFSWTEEFTHTEYGTIEDGQFSQPALGGRDARQLRQLDNIETLTLTWTPAWLVAYNLDPAYVKRVLQQIGRSRRAFLLTATAKNSPTPTLMRTPATLRSLGTAMRQGEPDTLYYTLTIAEWRDAEVERRGHRRGKGDDGRGGNLPTTHELEAIDTLYSLSRHFYKTHAGADDIAKANGIKTFGKKTPLVEYGGYKVGTKIKIPKIKSKLVAKFIGEASDG